MLRLYNAQTHQWSIYWGSAKSAALDAPLVGEFTNDRGVFCNQDPNVQALPMIKFASRTWPTSSRFEQALSADGRKTWETNWIMTFTRS